jgi:hypothetical protein
MPVRHSGGSEKCGKYFQVLKMTNLFCKPEDVHQCNVPNLRQITKSSIKEQTDRFIATAKAKIRSEVFLTPILGTSSHEFVFMHREHHACP